MKKLFSFLIAVGLGFSGIVLAVQMDQPRNDVLLRPVNAGILEKVKERARITTQEFQQNREELKKIMEENQVEFQNQIKQKREEIKTRIEAFQEKLKTRLRERIKNEQKQKIVERVYKRINELNERITKHYLDVLDKLEKILERIETRAAKAKLNGLDISSVETAISQAKTEINNAREAVRVQSEKVYQAPEITSETNLKTDVGKLRQELHSDLKVVEKVVKDARKAVHEAAILLAQIPKVDNLEVPTTTQPTP